MYTLIRRSVASDLGLHCFIRHVCPIFRIITVKLQVHKISLNSGGAIRFTKRHKHCSGDKTKLNKTDFMSPMSFEEWYFHLPTKRYQKEINARHHSTKYK